jgi:hypothetical protein
VFDEKVLSKIPKGPLKDKKKDWSADKYVAVGFHRCCYIRIHHQLKPCDVIILFFRVC